jgi:RHS repeat-associated protein
MDSPVRDCRGGEAVAIAMEPKGGTPESPTCRMAGNRQKSAITYNPHASSTPEYVSKYTQLFSFDAAGFGNMILKDSAEKTSTIKPIGDDLNYTFDYEYDSEKYAHRLLRAGDRHYKYDANGNIVEEKEGAFDEAGGEKYHKINEEADNVYSTDYGWGLFREKESVKNSERYHRTYTWNEKNQLVSTSDSRYTVNYVYGQDGQRAAKYTAQSETLYFNKMWTLHTDGGNSHLGGEYAKNVYLGETRIVTKLVSANEIRAWEEVNKIYFYHSDHLGSASLITDENGNEYQRLEYTPYGEVWVDKYSQIQESTALLPYKFTGKERDEETGLYYYGARYLDAKYSRWMSTDPALGEYMSGSDIGCGGIYNSINLNLYHYANNNPIKYNDPTGMWVPDADGNLIAEEGDGITSLAKFQNITYNEAKEQLLSQGYKIKDDYLDLKVGDKITMDNVYTKSISNSSSTCTTEGYLAGTITKKDNPPVPEDYYNCWGSAIAGSQGKDIKMGVGIKKAELFDSELSENYSSVSSSDAKFGKTVLRFADSKNEAQHGAVYYGTSKDGTVYVYTKNGWELKPTVMKLTDLINGFPVYGNIKGMKTGECGYYNYGKR